MPAKDTMAAGRDVARKVDQMINEAPCPFDAEASVYEMLACRWSDAADDGSALASKLTEILLDAAALTRKLRDS